MEHFSKNKTKAKSELETSDSKVKKFEAVLNFFDQFDRNSLNEK